MDKKKIWESYKFPLLLLGGILTGAIIGLIFGEKATVLAPVGDIFINLMFTIVVPMVFVSITSAVGSMLNMKRLGKILGSMVLVFLVTGFFAAVLVLVVVNIWPPAANTSITMQSAEMGEAASMSSMIVNSITVDDFSGLLSRENMLSLIVFSIMTGIAVSACGGEESIVGHLLVNMNDVIMRIVAMIMKLAPIGLGVYFANLVGEFGPKLIGDYGRTMLIYYPMCLLYGFVFYPMYAYFAGGKEGVRRMAKNILNPAVTSFATQSSVATLPTNLESCNKIGVPSDISNIVLPMGATMHMDGSVISSITKIAFLFGVFQMPYTGASTYVMSVVVSILSAFVLSGAPGGGLVVVGEMLIVSLFGFPGEAFPLIATIGFLVDPVAICLNSSGDTIASMIVTRLVEGKNWMEGLHSEKTTYGPYLLEVNGGSLISEEERKTASLFCNGAIEARVLRLSKPAMSITGSGAHGIIATMPLYVAYKVNGYTKENLLRATALSYLICMYIKEYSGKLSAFCGCAIAAGTGMACGLAFLRGVDVEMLGKIINNMASSITGMICDGGNQGCTMKGIVAVDAAYAAVDMAMKDVYIYNVHGINGRTPEETMKNMGRIASPGMIGTEKTIIEILEEKK